MKKLCRAALAAMMLFTVVGCASEGTEDEKQGETKGTEQEEQKENQTEEKKDVYAMKETVHLEDMDVTVNSVSTSEGENYTKPEDGKVFVLINVTITNTSDEDISYNVLYSKIQNAQGQINSLGFSMLNVKDKLHSGKLIPGGTITGTVVTEAAADEINSMIFIYEPNPFSDEEAKVQLSI